MTRNQAIIASFITVLLFAIVMQINRCMDYRRQTSFGKIASPFEFQQQLKDWGYYAGNIDGRFGEQTMQAWQQAIDAQRRGELRQRMNKQGGKTIKQIINEPDFTTTRLSSPKSEARSYAR